MSNSDELPLQDRWACYDAMKEFIEEVSKHYDLRDLGSDNDPVVSSRTECYIGFEYGTFRFEYADAKWHAELLIGSDVLALDCTTCIGHHNITFYFPVNGHIRAPVTDGPLLPQLISSELRSVPNPDGKPMSTADFRAWFQSLVQLSDEERDQVHSRSRCLIPPYPYTDLPFLYENEEEHKETPKEVKEEMPPEENTEDQEEIVYPLLACMSAADASVLVDMIADDRMYPWVVNRVPELDVHFQAFAKLCEHDVVLGRDKNYRDMVFIIIPGDDDQYRLLVFTCPGADMHPLEYMPVLKFATVKFRWSGDPEKTARQSLTISEAEQWWMTESGKLHQSPEPPSDAKNTQGSLREVYEQYLKQIWSQENTASYYKAKDYRAGSPQIRQPGERLTPKDIKLPEENKPEETQEKKDGELTWDNTGKVSVQIDGEKVPLEAPAEHPAPTGRPFSFLQLANTIEARSYKDVEYNVCKRVNITETDTGLEVEFTVAASWKTSRYMAHVWLNVITHPTDESPVRLETSLYVDYADDLEVELFPLPDSGYVTGTEYTSIAALITARLKSCIDIDKANEVTQ